jgi:hypothetical protein
MQHSSPHTVVARFLRGLAEAGPDEEISKKSGPPPRWQEWLEKVHQGGKGRVPNPNWKTYDKSPEVSFGTALKVDTFFQKALKEYKAWVKKNPGTDEKAPPKAEEKETPKTKEVPKEPTPKEPPPKKPAQESSLGFELSKDRYKDTAFEKVEKKAVKGKWEYTTSKLGTKELKQLLSNFPGGKMSSVEDLSDLAGGGAGKSTRVQFLGVGTAPPLVMEVESEYTNGQTRKLKVDDDGDLYIYNSTLSLKPDAPKGMGTRILASQVTAARALGVKYLKCEAFRNSSDPGWVGYKVWPKMGYDGEVPEGVASKVPDDLADELKEIGAKKPWMVSDLYTTKSGVQWWEENGDSFEAKFDLADDSHSMRVFKAYLDKVAKRSGTPMQDFLKQSTRAVVSKYLASKSSPPKDKGKHEELKPDKDEDKDLDDVWAKIRKDRRKPKKI